MSDPQGDRPLPPLPASAEGHVARRTAPRHIDNYAPSRSPCPISRLEFPEAPWRYAHDPGADKPHATEDDEPLDNGHVGPVWVGAALLGVVVAIWLFGCAHAIVQGASQ